MFNFAILRIAFPLALLGMFLFSPFAHADYSIQTSSNNNSIAAFGNASSDIVYAQKFTSLGAGQVYTGSVLVSWDAGLPGDHLNCSILEDSAGPHGANLGTSNNFTASTMYPTFTSETLTFSSPPSLAAASDYWLTCERSGAASGGSYYVYAGEASATVPPSQVCATGPVSCSSDMKTGNILINVTEGGTPTTTPQTASTTVISDPNRDFFNGILLFMVGMIFMTWLFGKRK